MNFRDVLSNLIDVRGSMIIDDPATLADKQTINLIQWADLYCNDDCEIDSLIHAIPKYAINRIVNNLLVAITVDPTEFTEHQFRMFNEILDDVKPETPSRLLVKILSLRPDVPPIKILSDNALQRRIQWFTSGDAILNLEKLINESNKRRYNTITNISLGTKLPKDIVRYLSDWTDTPKHIHSRMGLGTKGTKGKNKGKTKGTKGKNKK